MLIQKCWVVVHSSWWCIVCYFSVRFIRRISFTNDDLSFGQRYFKFSLFVIQKYKTRDFENIYSCSWKTFCYSFLKQKTNRNAILLNFKWNISRYSITSILQRNEMRKVSQEKNCIHFIFLFCKELRSSKVSILLQVRLQVYYCWSIDHSSFPR